MKLGLEWGLDKMMMTLAEPSVHDKKKIQEDNDLGDVELLLDLWLVDSASKRN
jgi:hypothetical protein